MEGRSHITVCPEGFCAGGGCASGGREGFVNAHGAMNRATEQFRLWPVGRVFYNWQESSSQVHALGTAM